MKYIPLNVKTNYSLLSSLIDIDKLIKKCIQMNIDTIAICDCNMYGVIEFYYSCIKNNIKPIIGLEVEFSNKKVLMYAKNYEGYQELCRINTKKIKNTLNINDILSNNLLFILPIDSEEIGEKLVNCDVIIGLPVNEIRCLTLEEEKYLSYIYMIRDGLKEKDNPNYIVSNNYLYIPILTKEEEKKYQYINDECNVKIDLRKDLLPKYLLDNNINAREYLEALCRKGLEKRKKIYKEYIERLKYEIDIINKMGFCDYFLVVWDYVRYAKKNNILVGPGRGSAASSLVSYVLGITDVDPLEYNLLFERFLNPERITMPDIDIDFDADKRNLMIEYVTNKYGEKRAVQILTFGTMAYKQSIRDVARILDFSNSDLEQVLLKIIYDEKNNRVSINSNDFRINHLIDITNHIIGLKRHTSLHAAGVVIAPVDLDNFIPLDINDKYYVTGIDMTYLETLGLLKMDFLSLKNLTLLQQTWDQIGNIPELPLNDLDTYKLFSDGNTAGVFQFESEGMKKFLRDLKPSNFNDLVAAIALYRPGPMQNIGEYVARKYKKKKIDYLHPVLEPILKETYGIIVYQEQIMQIATSLAGYTLGQADVLRRAMSKKKHDIMEMEREKFLTGSEKRGFDKELSEQVFNLIYKFSDYGFNKAHSVSYALIGYQMAYLKTHYNYIYMGSLLTSVIGSENKIKEYINECRVLGIEIISPDINISSNHFIPYYKKICYALSAVKNIGNNIANIIINERENGEYKDFFDFVARTYFLGVNRKCIESLIDAGSFNSFNYSSKTFHQNIDRAVNYAELIRDLDSSLVEVPVMEEWDNYLEDELLTREYNVLGLYLTTYPTTRFQTNITLGNINNYFDKEISIALYLERFNEIKTKKDEAMMFVTASDLFGKIDLVIFPKVLKQISIELKKNVYLVKGKVEKRFAKYQIIVNEITKLD